MSNLHEEGQTYSITKKIIIPPGEFRYPKNSESHDLIKNHIEKYGFDVITYTYLKENKQMEYYVYPKTYKIIGLFYRIIINFSTQTEKVECPTCGHIKNVTKYLCTFQEAEPLSNIVELDEKLIEENKHLKKEIDDYTHGWERCDKIVIEFDPYEAEYQFLDEFSEPLTFIERCMYETHAEEGGWLGEYEWNYKLGRSESGWIYIEKLGIITKFRFTECANSYGFDLLEEVVEKMPEPLTFN